MYEVAEPFVFRAPENIDLALTIKKIKESKLVKKKLSKVETLQKLLLVSKQFEVVESAQNQ